MRRLAWFLIAVASFVVAIGALNRWVDPFGRFYAAAVAQRALSQPEPCRLSVNFTGAGAPEATLAFKRDLLRRRRPRTVVVGTSPVLPIHARPDEKGFVNLGLPNAGVETFVPLFRDVRARTRGAVTVYVGTSPFWFNPSWRSNYEGLPLGRPSRLRLGVVPLTDLHDVKEALRYLLARDTLSESVSLVARAGLGAFGGSERTVVRGRCVLERGARVSRGEAEAWEPDGSLSSRWSLVPRVERPESRDFEEDLVHFTSGLYGDWTSFDREKARELDRALRLAKRYGWTVVGFGTPYSDRYVRRLATHPATRRRWRDYMSRVPPLFERRGFAFVDLSQAGDVPCGQREFDYGNDGWHVDRSCAARLRRRLDRVASELGAREGRARVAGAH